MRLLKRLYNRWTARRRELAIAQLQAEGIGEIGRMPATDAFTGRHQESAKALGRMINPTATTHTEWTGD